MVSGVELHTQSYKIKAIPNGLRCTCQVSSRFIGIDENLNYYYILRLVFF